MGPSFLRARRLGPGRSETRYVFTTLLHTQLAVALAVHLMKRRDPWVDRFEVIRRL